MRLILHKIKIFLMRFKKRKRPEDQIFVYEEDNDN